MNESTVKAIKAYMDLGAYVYMALPDTKYNSEEGGYKNSFNQWTDLAEWLEKHPQYKGGNVGIDLDQSPLVVVDVDQHQANGLQSLNDYLKRQQVAPESISSTYLEKTPSGGWHVFYKSEGNQSKTRKINAIAGLDVLNSGGVIVSPSTIADQPYQAVTDWGTLQDRPTWVDGLLSDTADNERQTHKQARYSVAERWGMFIDGFTTGQRNDQATSLIGWLLSYRLDPRQALKIAEVVNGRSVEPLAYGELERVYMSVLRREIARAKNRGTGGA